MLSCHSGEPENKLGSDTFQKVLWDFIRADVYTTDVLAKKDSTLNRNLANAALQKKIFATHKVSKDDFFETFEYYKAHPVTMSVVLDSLMSRETRNQEAYMKRQMKLDSIRNAKLIKDTIHVE
jgi:hypothetical protein